MADGLLFQIKCFIWNLFIFFYFKLKCFSLYFLNSQCLYGHIQRRRRLFRFNKKICVQFHTDSKIWKIFSFIVRVNMFATIMAAIVIWSLHTCYVFRNYEVDSLCRHICFNLLVTALSQAKVLPSSNSWRSLYRLGRHAKISNECLQPTPCIVKSRCNHLE